MVKKKEEHTTFEVGPISEPRMRAIMEGLWVEGGVGRAALDESIRVWYKPELIRKSKAVADALKVEFVHGWSGYKTYAWGHDELRPISRTAYDWYSAPLGLTIVDNLDTLYLFELDTEFNTAVDWVKQSLNFNVNSDVSVFEVIIRWLGGLISAYLISGQERLLELAVDLANRLLPAYASPTGIPYGSVNLSTGVASRNTIATAEAGTNILEFGMLSKLTSDNSYYTAAKNAINAVYTRRSVLNLLGSEINVVTGAWTNTEAHIGGWIDSYLEYLPKAWMLFQDHDFLDWFNVLMGAKAANLEEIYNGLLYFRRVNMNTGVLTRRITGGLEQFFPVTLAQAGRLTEAEEFMRTCYAHYSSRRWGKLCPDSFDYSTGAIVSLTHSLGAYVSEPLFQLYVSTGKDEYRAMGYTMIADLINYMKVPAGFTNITNVTTMTPEDLMGSYFTETLKYLYMLFADSPRVNLDEALFSTESHPMRGFLQT